MTNHSTDTDQSPPSQRVLDRKTIELIDATAGTVRDCIERGELPAIELPVRSLANVDYDADRGYLELGEATKTRTLTVKTVRSFAQTLRLMAASRQMVESDDFATKREAYYISKNWGDCRFDEQAESDAVMDDIEALASRHGLAREQLRFYPESHGGSVAGHLSVIDADPETGARLEIDCAGLGSGAYSVPRSVERLGFRTDADFILAIETGGMFQRLNNHRFWKKANCILVEMGGVPTRATRRFIRRLSDAADLPVYCFVDCDPYGFANIYRTLKAGSGNAAHINRFFCVPRAQFLRRHAAGHHRLRPGRRHSSALQDRYQARGRRHRQRSVFRRSPALDRRHRTVARDGRAR
jgi:DNA topoisomerase-6 subunit A